MDEGTASRERAAGIVELIAAATGDDLGELLAGVAEALTGAGLPVWRLSLSMPTIDPLMQALGFVWRRDAGITPREDYVAGDASEQAFRRSPIFYLQEHGMGGARWRLAQGEGCEDIPFLADLQARGGTDYLMRLVRFGGPTTAALPGVALAVATDRPAGFAEQDVRLFDTIIPALGLVCHRYALMRTSAELLGIYLGARTAQRVMGGEVRRGMGRVIPAAILVADLRGFTALTDREDPLKVVGWLDEQLEAIGAPVAEGGGEVLKFLGDGLLAVFPSDGSAGSEAEACRQALTAAEEALRRTDTLGSARRARREPVLELDIVLHHGEVIYGNVGAARRLDFTVIGRAVNEACRMEELCERLGYHLLLSAPFAARCGRRAASLGRFELRGIGQKVEVLAPSPGPTHDDPASRSTTTRT
jgi:adenylate cyclase